MIMVLLQLLQWRNPSRTASATDKGLHLHFSIAQNPPNCIAISQIQLPSNHNSIAYLLAFAKL